MNLTGERLKKFHDSILKEKYSKEAYLKLRLVTVEVESLDEKTGEVKRKTVTLLINLPKDIMTIEDICEIYNYRWGIETNF